MPNRGPGSFGSLSASLLARKGQARPAMRSQSASPQGEDDLGWNDMGADTPDLPTVLIQRRTLNAEFSAAEPARVARAVEAITPEPARARAAFTLRLDADRHLRLRLASTLEGVSAQVLVIRAIDRFLQTIPDVEALASQLPPRTKRKSLGDDR